MTPQNVYVTRMTFYRIGLEKILFSLSETFCQIELILKPRLVSTEHFFCCFLHYMETSEISKRRKLFSMVITNMLQIWCMEIKIKKIK